MIVNQYNPLEIARHSRVNCCFGQRRAHEKIQTSEHQNAGEVH